MNLSQSEIKYLRSLQQKKQREEEGRFLLEGWRPLQDALESDSNIELIAVLPVSVKTTAHRFVLALAKDRKIPVKELKEGQLKQISDEVHSQGIVALLRQYREPFEHARLQSSKCIVVCDSVSDPGNLGTILRTCDWFGVDAVLLSRGCVSLYNEKVVRSTAGSIFHLKIFENVELSSALAGLHSEGFRIIASALDGTSIHSSVPADKSVLVFGSEAHGVDENILKLADEVLRIPRYGKAESLNVGIACGIFLAAWRDHQAGK